MNIEYRFDHFPIKMKLDSLFQGKFDIQVYGTEYKCILQFFFDDIHIKRSEESEI